MNQNLGPIFGTDYFAMIYFVYELIIFLHVLSFWTLSFLANIATLPNNMI